MCHVSVLVYIRIRGWACHVSNGGVLCEVATCSFRGGPYTIDLKLKLIDIETKSLDGDLPFACYDLVGLRAHVCERKKLFW